jgi:quinol monooxygenase YgiN
MPVVVVATLTPLPEHRDPVRDALRVAVAAVHGEDGCELYALNEAPDRFIMVERWSSADALAAHGKGAAIAQLNQALDGLVAGPADVIVLDPVPAGDPAKGLVGHG